MQLVHGSTQDVESFDLRMGEFCPDTRPTSEQILSMYQVFISAAVKILQNLRTISMASYTAPIFCEQSSLFCWLLRHSFCSVFLRLQVKFKGRSAERGKIFPDLRRDSSLLEPIKDLNGRHIMWVCFPGCLQTYIDCWFSLLIKSIVQELRTKNKCFDGVFFSRFIGRLLQPLAPPPAASFLQVALPRQSPF